MKEFCDLIAKRVSVKPDQHIVQFSLLRPIYIQPGEGELGGQVEMKMLVQTARLDTIKAQAHIEQDLVRDFDIYGGSLAQETARQIERIIRTRANNEVWDKLKALSVPAEDVKPRGWIARLRKWIKCDGLVRTELQIKLMIFKHVMRVQSQVRGDKPKIFVSPGAALEWALSSNDLVRADNSYAIASDGHPVLVGYLSGCQIFFDRGAPQNTFTVLATANKYDIQYACTPIEWQDFKKVGLSATMSDVTTIVGQIKHAIYLHKDGIKFVQYRFRTWDTLNPFQRFSEKCFNFLEDILN